MKIYLAIPYTFNAELSTRIADRVAANLMTVGHVVFSPISHSHRVSDHLDPALRYDQEFWMNQDIPFIDWAEEIHLVVIGENGHELIENSKGCQTEIAHAKKTNKPIKIIEFYD